jgi:PKD repeat protein/glucose/arabinose dehydrogenase
MKLRSVITVSICLLYFSSSAQQAVLPVNFQSILVSDIWNEAVCLRFDANGQMYVCEKGGKIWVTDTNGSVYANPLLDISEEVGNWRDHGLLGFALDPNFLSNGFFYVSYVVDRHYLLYYGTPSYSATANDYFKATIARVVRYKANAATNFSTIVPGSRHILIGEDIKSGIPVLHLSHSVGQLQFGTDGSLLVATGDGASYNGLDTGVHHQAYWQMALNDSIIREDENIGTFRSQYIHSLNGKILRIDPTSGNGLPSNPFYDPANPRSAASRIWALGLRNPYRMVVKPGSGSTDITEGKPGVIYLGDVGWNNWEEFDICKSPGQNFGWPIYEGLRFISGYYNVAPMNASAPNPLYGIVPGCESHFRFRHLLINATLNPPFWANPCSLSVPVAAPNQFFMHSRPEIDWSHDSAYVRTGIFVNNNAATVSITDPNSPVQGSHFQGFASVGGVFYRGHRYPAIYQQSYFHTDYVGGWIKQFIVDSTERINAIQDFAEDLGPVVHLEYNPKDELIYYIMYPNSIYKIRYNGQVHNPPTARIEANKIFGASPLKVKFVGMHSSDPDQDSLAFYWDFGDGSFSTDKNPIHEFIAPSNNSHTCSVKLTVTDSSGLSDSATIHIYLNNTPPAVEISSIADGQLYSVSYPSTIPLEAEVTDAEHDSTQLKYRWQVTLHHNQHSHPESADTNKITQAVITPTDCNPYETYFYRIRLTVTDAEGLSGFDEVDMFPACSKPMSQFTAATTGICTQEQVSFTDQTTGLADSYEWHFQGGVPSVSTLKNPIVQYPNAGLFDVMLITENGGGRDTLLKPAYIDVREKPQALITPAGNDSLCTGQSLILNVHSGINLSYQWMRNGFIIPMANQSSYTATQGGEYRVTVSESNGCSQMSDPKTITEKYINAEIIIDGNANNCIDSVTFLAASSTANAYQWKKNGVFIPGASGPVFRTKSNGTYSVMAYSAEGCSIESNSIRLSNYCTNAVLKTAFTTENYLMVFPNPASGCFTITSDQELCSPVIRLTDAAGKTIYHSDKYTGQCNHEFRIEMEPPVNGVYFLHILTASESRFITLTVIR